jgi:D-alanyl-D-alanine dipeptidase
MKEIYNDLKTDPSGFVLLSEFVPSIIQEIRYYTTYNFIGDRIDGYEEPCALLTKEAARALKAASSELIVQGYRLKVFDAYRPACAVKHFILWGIEDQDIRMKPYFYPELEKHELFERGYISKRSSHSRGSALDLTLFDMKAGKEVDMGSPFDLFSEVSHPDYRGIKITDEQYDNRMILQKAMVRNGFEPFECEWWHFRLEKEPYPDTFFEFPVSGEYLRKQ